MCEIIEHRKEDRCPKCQGILEKKDGRLECLSCNYGQIERRRKFPVELDEWAIKGGR